jgi:GNAT superfamily N-acetyltransferase
MLDAKTVVTLVPYDPIVHREQFFELNVEYLTWFVNESIAQDRIDLQSMTGPTVREYVEGVIDDYTSIPPSEGIIYVLEVEVEIVGMGALKKLKEGIGEIKRMYIRSEYRGRKYGKAMLAKLLDYAKNLGYVRIRLDTADFLTVAQHIYRSAGFKEIEEYVGSEMPSWNRPYTVFMEKKL